MWITNLVEKSHSMVLNFIKFIIVIATGGSILGGSKNVFCPTPPHGRSSAGCQRLS